MPHGQRLKIFSRHRVRFLVNLKNATDIVILYSMSHDQTIYEKEISIFVHGVLSYTVFVRVISFGIKSQE